MERVRGNTLKRGSYTSQIMRLAGRLLLNLRKIKPLSGIPEPWIWDYLKPEHFSSIVDAAILTSVPVQDDDESIESPSNAIKLGYDIKRLINGKIGLSIINNNPTSREDAENLIKLMSIYWGTKVTKHARVILEERKYYAVKNFPLPEDIQKLSNHLRDSILSLDLSKTDSANFREVGRLIETKLVTFNRRRTGEVQAIRLADYARRIKGQAGAHLVGDLSKFEKHLLESQEVMTVRGKTGRPVPIILPQDTVQGLQYLTDPDIRKSAGVNSSKGDSVIWAYEALKKTAEAAMLRNPGAITSTNLRKYMATITQVLDLKEHQMQWVLNHMGHTLDVHKLHYRATSDVLERTQIAKILMLQDQGRVGEFRNMCLNDIDLEDIVFQTSPVSNQIPTSGIPTISNETECPELEVLQVFQTSPVSNQIPTSGIPTTSNETECPELEVLQVFQTSPVSNQIPTSGIPTTSNETECPELEVLQVFQTSPVSNQIPTSGIPTTSNETECPELEVLPDFQTSPVSNQIPTSGIPTTSNETEYPELEVLQVYGEEENPKVRRRPTKPFTKKIWTTEEEMEIQTLLKRFFELQQRPKPKDCLKVIEKSKKQNGVIWKRKKRRFEEESFSNDR